MSIITYYINIFSIAYSMCSVHWAVWDSGNVRILSVCKNYLSKIRTKPISFNHTSNNLLFLASLVKI